MATDHVHAHAIERTVAQKLPTSRNRTVNWPQWMKNRYLRVIWITVMWVTTIGLTLLLVSYLKLVGTILLVLMFACLVAHEAGHYFEMKKAGVPVEEVGIGLPFGIFRALQYEILPGKLPFRLKVSPLWVAFYVDEGASGKPVLESLDFKSKVRIFAAGPTVNLVLFLLLIAALPIHSLWSSYISVSGLPFLFVLALTITSWLIFKRWFPEAPHLITAVMSVVVIAILIATVGVVMVSEPLTAFTNGGSFEGQPANVIGPVTMVKLMAQNADPFGGRLGSNPVLNMHGFLAILNFGLAATNFLPVRWFDGGQIWGEILKRANEKKANRRLWASTIAIFTPLVLILLFSEFPLTLALVFVTIISSLTLMALLETRMKTVRECMQTCSTT